MSRNFELLKQAEVPAAVQAMPHSAPAPDEQVGLPPSLVSSDAEIAAPSGEVELLVQRTFILPSQPPKLVVISEIGIGQRQSTVAYEVASAVASNGKTACLVEMDDSAGVEGSPGNDGGLAESLLMPDTPLSKFLRPVGRSSLWVMPAGQHAIDMPAAALNEMLRKRLGELRNAFDFVVVRAPSMDTWPQGLLFARISDGVILVVEALKSSRSAVREVVEELRHSKANVLGVVFYRENSWVPAWLAGRL